MKTLFLNTFLSLFFFTTTAVAQQSELTAPIRQAVIRVKIEKKTYNPENGLPRFDVTLVCNQQKTINVYQTPFEQLFLDPRDLNLVQCDAELFGAPVSVVVGGYINLYQDASTGTPMQLKSASLLLSWGELQREVPQVVYPAATNPWSYYVAVLSPIATGKIVDSVPQPPEPREFFMATISIIDQP